MAAMFIGMHTSGPQLVGRQDLISSPGGYPPQGGCRPTGFTPASARVCSGPAGSRVEPSKSHTAVGLNSSNRSQSESNAVLRGAMPSTQTDNFALHSTTHVNRARVLGVIQRDPRHSSREKFATSLTAAKRPSEDLSATTMHMPQHDAAMQPATRASHASVALRNTTSGHRASALGCAQRDPRHASREKFATSAMATQNRSKALSAKTMHTPPPKQQQQHDATPQKHARDTAGPCTQRLCGDNVEQNRVGEREEIAPPTKPLGDMPQDSHAQLCSQQPQLPQPCRSDESSLASREPAQPATDAATQPVTQTARAPAAVQGTATSQEGDPRTHGSKCLLGHKFSNLATHLKKWIPHWFHAFLCEEYRLSGDAGEPPHLSSMHIMLQPLLQECNVEVLLMSLVYFQRVLKRRRECERQVNTSWWQIFLAACVVADKINEDAPLRSIDWQKLFPADLAEGQLWCLEKELLLDLGYQPNVKTEEFEKICGELLQHSRAEQTKIIMKRSTRHSSPSPSADTFSCMHSVQDGAPPFSPVRASQSPSALAAATPAFAKLSGSGNRGNECPQVHATMQYNHQNAVELAGHAGGPPSSTSPTDVQRNDQNDVCSHSEPAPRCASSLAASSAGGTHQSPIQYANQTFVRRPGGPSGPVQNLDADNSAPGRLRRIGLRSNGTTGSFTAPRGRAASASAAAVTRQKGPSMSAMAATPYGVSAGRLSVGAGSCNLPSGSSGIPVSGHPSRGRAGW
eukprot:gnl/TRDRNA2_/TRDRNA2_161098_c0_seq1.p1 gnl/TRDRNA2_/TRDRNA2_161098_c0~~gnl/TRDRNA2_/TRDRNA2_161098_c0_seq1.p1  ORF type:complete len:742 (-),score=99.83 gnl/TRDRNA2_/TRDRNA2_161098_c0_seq1:90-2315(-)